MTDNNANNGNGASVTPGESIPTEDENFLHTNKGKGENRHSEEGDKNHNTVSSRSSRFDEIIKTEVKEFIKDKLKNMKIRAWQWIAISEFAIIYLMIDADRGDHSYVSIIKKIINNVLTTFHC